MDAVGGRLNAFTAKEHTCYYANVLARDLPMAVDLLSRRGRPTRCITAEDVEAERGVMLEEIAMRDDDPPTSCTTCSPRPCSATPRSAGR